MGHGSRRSLQLRTTSIRTGVSLVTVGGELDSASGEQLRNELDRLPSPGDVIVDIEGVDLVDTSALATLLGAASRLRRLGNELTVVCERQPTIAGLLRRLGLHVSEAHDDAIRYLFGRKLLQAVREHALEAPAQGSIRPRRIA